MLKKQLENRLIDARNSVVKTADDVDILLNKEIRGMSDGVDRDQLIMVLTQFRGVKKLLSVGG